MSTPWTVWLELLVATGAALWAGLLVLADEAPALPHSLGDPPPARGEPIPVHRALQVARVALLVVAGAAAAAAIEWWRRPPAEGAIGLLLTGALLYLIADALPRGIGVLLPQLASMVVSPVRRSLVTLGPLLGVVAATGRLLQMVLPPRAPTVTGLGEGERDVLAGVVSLRDGVVAEAMTPRLDIAAIETGADWREVVETLRRSERARLPVYEGDLDRIVGVLYAKDLTPVVAGIAPHPKRWQEIVRPAQFVPESKSLVSQLRDFQRGPSHIAIVVDEFGGTSGLITLEDVLEEAVGEIYGEYDREERPPITSEGDDKFWVDGTVTLDDLSESLRTAIDREDVSTVGGLIYSELGRVPRPGEELRIGEFRVVVEQVIRRRIRRVYFERRAHEPAEGVGETAL
jgi:CBS domain containing-hemolysin-like protein